MSDNGHYVAFPGRIVAVGPEGWADAGTGLPGGPLLPHRGGYSRIRLRVGGVAIRSNFVIRKLPS